MPTSTINPSLAQSFEPQLSHLKTLTTQTNGATIDSAADSDCQQRHGLCLASHIELVVREYFANLRHEQPTHLYDLMLHQFEKPLISVVLEYTRGNQTRTAEILGLNRGTLRKKLKVHQLL